MRISRRRRRAVVIEYVESALSGDNHILATVLVHIGDIELHPDAHYVIWRWIDSALVGVIRQMVEGQNVPLEFSAFDIVPKGI